MRKIYIALKKFLKGEISSDQLLGELSFNLNDCSEVDEETKYELGQLKTELYKLNEDTIRVNQLAKCCLDKLSPFFDVATDSTNSQKQSENNDTSIEIDGEVVSENCDQGEKTKTNTKNFKDNQDEQGFKRVKNFIGDVINEVTDSLKEVFEDVKKEINDLKKK